MAEAAAPNPFTTALALEAAKDAGLRYFPDSRKGFTRQKNGSDFFYTTADGARVSDSNTLVRIKRLAIPPAWEKVWICPVENGHIQATGRDARGRKQYRYHARWREQRDQNKFSRMIAFANVLPAVRRAVARDMARRGAPRKKVLATVVRLLELTLIRVGNDEYARTNKSYGLTTMHDRHVKVRGQRISFDFKGKSGVQHSIDIHDPLLARIVKRCQDLPGQELFAYHEESGTVRDVTSQDVNEYLRGVTGEDFTAKDFRTWAGTVLAAIALREFAKSTSQTEAKKNITTAVQAVAKVLGNTPAVCRKCYVHPAILDSYLQGSTIEVARQRVRRELSTNAALKPDEAAVLGFLQTRLKPSEKASGSTARRLAASSNVKTAFVCEQHRAH